LVVLTIASSAAVVFANNAEDEAIVDSVLKNKWFNRSGNL